jgi:chemotaxis protein CheD
MSLTTSVNHYVGIGEYMISKDSTNTIKTFALSSCVAVLAYHPIKLVAGMIHIALPSPTESSFIKDRPAYFASTGVPLMLREIHTKYGCLPGELIIRIYGGAKSVRANDFFHIGERNIKAVKQVLSGLNLRIHKEDIGGFVSRTLEMRVNTGIVKVIEQPLCI